MAAVANQTRLEVLENEINTEAFEAFYHIGQKLLEIKHNPQLYEDAGYKSWSAYCASGRIEFNKSQADVYIRSSELRSKMGTNSTHEFGVSQMRELCKCETDNDAKRVAKKAITQANKTNQRVTAKLISQVRDGDDETGAASKRQRRALDAASLEKHLEKLSNLLVEWRISLERVDLEHWEDLSPSVLTRVRSEAKDLSIFLES